MFIYVCITLKVLSSSVSSDLALTGGKEASETAKFVAVFDSFLISYMCKISQVSPCKKAFSTAISLCR